MKKVDYIIIGGGYAGFFFAHQLKMAGRSFVLFSGKKEGASHVSAGMVNPVVLKKFTTFWLAQEQLNLLHQTLLEMKEYTNEDYFVSEPIHRIFHDENEQKLWLRKALVDELSPFLNTNFESFSTILNPFKTGEVSQSGRLDVGRFFKGLTDYFINTGELIADEFSFDELNVSEKSYRDFSYKQVVFCEGMRVLENPFFCHIPVQPNKGHHLSVRLSKKPANRTFKKKHFLFPVSDDSFYYGGTYDRDRIDSEIDPEAVQQLEKGLSEFYPFPFEVIGVECGFRPTVKDRRPIIGRHFKEKDLYVFNGLGARGVLNGCYFSRSLFDFIENEKTLPREVDISRFDIPAYKVHGS